MALLSACAAGCGGGGGLFGTANPTAPGNTSKQPAETTLWVLGTPNTPFQATLTDTVASWTIKGVVPESVVIINNSPGLRMVVSKLTNMPTLLSVEILSGVTLLEEVSTNDPFGTVVVQTAGGVVRIAPKANPDIRIFVKGPSGGMFTGLVEDLTLGFVVETRAPALFMFERPDGRVDGEFSSLDTAGLFAVDILSQGNVAVQATGGPNLNVKFP